MSGENENITLLPAGAPVEAFESISQTALDNGGEFKAPAEYEGSFGRTLFDSPSSEDGLITVVMPPGEVDNRALPSHCCGLSVRR
jgi:hypothetical protein